MHETQWICKATDSAQRSKATHDTSQTKIYSISLFQKSNLKEILWFEQINCNACNEIHLICRGKWVSCALQRMLMLEQRCPMLEHIVCNIMVQHVSYALVKQYPITKHRYTKQDILCYLQFGATHSNTFIIINLNFYQVKMLMFYNVQTTNSSFVG